MVLAPFINTIDVLKNASFKLFKMANPSEKIDFLHFIRRIVMHYLQEARNRRQMKPMMIYPRKRSWKGETPVSKNKRINKRHFIENSTQKCCRICSTRPRTWCPTCEVGLCWSRALKFSTQTIEEIVQV